MNIALCIYVAAGCRSVLAISRHLKCVVSICSCMLTYRRTCPPSFVCVACAEPHPQKCWLANPNHPPLPAPFTAPNMTMIKTEDRNGRSARKPPSCTHNGSMCPLWAHNFPHSGAQLAPRSNTHHPADAKRLMPVVGNVASTTVRQTNRRCRTFAENKISCSSEL